MIRGPGDEKPARDRHRVHDCEQLPGRGIAPAALDVHVGQPRVQAVEHRRHEEERSDEPPGEKPAERQLQGPKVGTAVSRLGARQPEPQHGEPRRHDTEDEQRCAPTAREVGERDCGSSGDGRADRDARRVDPRCEAWTVGEALLHRHGQDRACDPHPDADREGQEDHPGRARRDRPNDAEDADQRQRQGDCPARPDPARDEGRRWSEEAHAEHRDRAEQAGNRMCDVQVLLDERQQRADADELWPQRQRSQKQCDEQRRPFHGC